MAVKPSFRTLCDHAELAAVRIGSSRERESITGIIYHK